jgi:hypothetical protein
MVEDVILLNNFIGETDEEEEAASEHDAYAKVFIKTLKQD